VVLGPACALVSLGAVHGPQKRLVESMDELGLHSGHEVGEPLSFHEELQPLRERRTKLLILAIRPGLGNYEPEAALPKPPLHGAISDLHLERLSGIAVELPASQVHLCRLLGLLDYYFLQTGVRLWRDLPRPATSRLVDQPVDTLLVEPLDPVVHRAFGDGEQLRHDGAGYSEQRCLDRLYAESVLPALRAPDRHIQLR